jgi:glycine/D-amino acid oxidase-like deaminating enzyme
MADTTDVVIVGGGVAGCATAYYLAKQGIKSTIIEREGIASKASGFSAGGLNPLQGAGIPGPLGPLAIKSFRMHEEIWPELLESGVDFEPETISVVAVAYDESEFAAMEETKKIFDGADGDFKATWLDADQIREMEPRLAPGALRGLDAYGNRTLSSYRFVLALVQTIEKMGSTVRSGEVLGVKTDGRRVTSVVLESGEINCGSVVFATGPWSARFLRNLGIELPLRPTLAEVFVLRRPMDRVPAHPGGSDRSNGIYFRPEGANLTLVGGMPAPGERAGAAFRYKDGDELWVLQAVTHLPGGGQSHHTRHVGHTVLRGYEGKGISAVLWQDGGATYLFSGPGKVSHVLDQTQLAVFGVSAGGSDH